MCVANHIPNHFLDGCPIFTIVLIFLPGFGQVQQHQHGFNPDRFGAQARVKPFGQPQLHLHGPMPGAPVACGGIAGFAAYVTQTGIAPSPMEHFPGPPIGNRSTQKALGVPVRNPGQLEPPSPFSVRNFPSRLPDQASTFHECAGRRKGQALASPPGIAGTGREVRYAPAIHGRAGRLCLDDRHVRGCRAGANGPPAVRFPPPPLTGAGGAPGTRRRSRP